MAVPARPASGAPIDSAWGGIVHDAVAAMDVQSGKVTCVHTGNLLSAPVNITFPRAFTAPPVIILSSTNYNYSAGNPAPPSATATTIYTRRLDGSAATGNIEVHWLAYGPRS